MRIKVIATGSSAGERLAGRWGVSFLIGRSVLFDTFGDPGVLLDNIRRFNVDTGRIRHIVLSHDDWDHIGGLRPLIENRKDITVYICPGSRREIKRRFASSGVKLVEMRKAAQIKNGICSTGELTGRSSGRKIYEQSLVVKTPGGTTVICGCAHPGAVKIVRSVRRRFRGGVNCLIGGFHLKDNTDRKNKSVIAALRRLGVRRIAPTHCTGERATEMMRGAFGSGFIRVREGASIEV